MPKKEQEKKSIIEKDVNILKEQIGSTGKTKTILRLVRWCVDGNDGKLMLEKRSYNADKDGNWRISKAKGMTKEDLDYVFGQWTELSLYF